MSTVASERELLTAEDVARRLRVSLATVYRLVAAGKLPGYRFAATGPLRFDAEELGRFLAENRAPAGALPGNERAAASSDDG
jgi:excisionase family DNA binding protein